MRDNDFIFFYLGKGERQTQGKRLPFRCPEESLILTRVPQTEWHRYRSLTRAVMVTGEVLYQFIQLLETDIFKVYVPKVLPEYIAQACPEGGLPLRLLAELCGGGGLPAPSGRFLLYSLTSMFLGRRDFLPFLKGNLKKSLRAQVTAMISKDVGGPWSQRMVADRLYVSMSQLKKKLKEEGTSYRQILHECRMEKAGELIAMRDRTVKEIAHLCGYSSVSYFIGQYREYYGHTPGRPD